MMDIVKFSFLEEPTVFAIKTLFSIIPGIKNSIGIYYSEQSKNIEAIQYSHNSQFNAELLNISENTSFFEKLRKEKSTHRWYKKNELPFEVEKETKLQMDIFKEIENDVLMLSFENKTDGNCDLIFLFLDENFNFGNFRISESQKVLSSENKSIISNLAYNSMKAILENNKINGNAYKMISTKFVSIIKESNKESETENKFQKLYQKTIEEYLRKTLDKLSKNNQNFRFEISENALTKLKTYEGSLENLNKIIKTAAFYAVNLNNSNENTIIIEETFIDLNVKDETKTVSQISNIDRYSKTILILDKLEKAAQEVIERELDITSANVGNACANPISAPAITDALKKHRNKILVLLKKYPENWKLIRNEFKPIRNLIASENQFKEQTA